MKKFLTFLVILALLFLGAQWYLSSSFMRDRVEAELEVALNREVTVEDIEVSLIHDFPSLSVELIEATVHDAEAAEGVISIPRTWINVAVVPLFRGVLWCEVELENAQIRLQVYADGSSSLDDLISEEWLNDEESSAFETIHIQGFSIRNSEVEYQNASGRNLGLIGIEATLAAHLSADSTAFEGDVTTTRVRLGAGTLMREVDLASLLALNLSADPDAETLQFAEATLSVGPHTLDLTGLPLDWNSIPAVIDLAVRLKDLAGLPTDEALALARDRLEAEAHDLVVREKERLRDRLDDAIEEGAERLKDELGRILGGN